jgi:hypothetical protein
MSQTDCMLTTQHSVMMAMTVRAKNGRRKRYDRARRMLKVGTFGGIALSSQSRRGAGPPRQQDAEAGCSPVAVYRARFGKGDSETGSRAGDSINLKRWLNSCPGLPLCMPTMDAMAGRTAVARTFALGRTRFGFSVGSEPGPYRMQLPDNDFNARDEPPGVSLSTCDTGTSHSRHSPTNIRCTPKSRQKQF